MTNVLTLAGKFRHILLWSIAALYLFFSPSLYYHFFPQEGKPLEVRQEHPKERGKIRYNVEACKFWSKNTASYVEGETYALWGWAFLEMGPDTLQADFDRFVVVYNDDNTYLFPVKIYRRPGVQDAFKDLGLSDLSSAGFYSVISRNALEAGEYRIGLLFKHKTQDTNYYVRTNKILLRSPNHLSLELVSK